MTAAIVLAGVLYFAYWAFGECTSIKDAVCPPEELPPRHL